jgi:hypothetical protein
MDRRILVSTLVSCALALSGPGGRLEAQDMPSPWRLEGRLRFSPRQGHSAAVFNDAVVIACGTRLGAMTVLTNDVWASPDGDAWERLAADPPFPARTDASMFAFRKTLWIVGGSRGEFHGRDTPEFLTDAWKSEDGRRWSAFDLSFLPPARKLAAFASADRIWIAVAPLDAPAGAEAPPSAALLFASRDGLNFKDLKAKGLPVPDRMWVHGGAYFAWSRSEGRIYSSRDGSSWKPQDGKAPAFLSAPAPLGPLLYAICDDGFRVSPDSLAWTKSPSGSGVPGFLRHLKGAASPSYGEKVRDGAALLAFKGSLWAVGGAPGADSRTPGASLGSFIMDNDVYETRDGSAWKRHAAEPRGSKPETRYGHASLVHGERLYVLGGREDPVSESLYADTWVRSSDGAWSRLGPRSTYRGGSEGGAIWEPRWRFGAASFKGRIYVSGGLSSPFDDSAQYRADVWSSEDGGSWRLETGDAAFGPRAGHSLVAFADRLWVIGGEGPAGVSETIITRTIAYSSADGRKWEPAAVQGEPRFAALQAAFVMGPRLWLSGGFYRAAGESYFTRETYSSPDGISWRREPPAPFFFFGAAACVLGGDRAYLAGGRGPDGLIGETNVLDAEGTWKASDPLPFPSFQPAAAVLGGKLIVSGGLDDANGPPSGAVWVRALP